MIFTDQIHVAMTKTCGLVATLVCQSNIFEKQIQNEVDIPSHSGHALYIEIKKNIILLVSISAETIEDDDCRRTCDVIVVIDFICFLIIENYSIESRVATSSAFSAVPLFRFLCFSV